MSLIVKKLPIHSGPNDSVDVQNLIRCPKAAGFYQKVAANSQPIRDGTYDQKLLFWAAQPLRVKRPIPYINYGMNYRSHFAHYIKSASRQITERQQLPPNFPISTSHFRRLTSFKFYFDPNNGFNILSTSSHESTRRLEAGISLATRRRRKTHGANRWWEVLGRNQYRYPRTIGNELRQALSPNFGPQNSSHSQIE